MKSSLVSVIIPICNGAVTIATAIQSVLDQTYQDFEILVIDDGSTDRSVPIIANFNDQRIQCFSYPNAGPAVSRNRGMKRARGEFTAFLDADDLWLPSKLDGQLHQLRANQDAVLAYGWANYVDEQYQFLCADDRPCYTGNVYQQLLSHNFIISGSNTMIRSCVFNEVGLFNESLFAVEDWELHTRIALTLKLHAFHRYWCSIGNRKIL